MKRYNTNARRFRIVSEPSNLLKVKITNSNDIYEWCKEMYDENKTDIAVSEVAYAIMLNNSNNIVAYNKISEGGITSAIIDIRLLMKFAINTLCTSMILVHNHPSGMLESSRQDKEITSKIQKGCNIFDIKLLDHLIITKEGYYSMSDKCDL